MFQKSKTILIMSCLFGLSAQAQSEQIPLQPLVSKIRKALKPTAPTPDPAPVMAVNPNNSPIIPPLSSFNTPPAKEGATGVVDDFLREILKTSQPSSDVIDTQAESSINRDMNLSRSVNQLIRPVGFLEVGSQKVVFALDDSSKIIRLKENSQLGLVKVVAISEYGVEYSIGGKTAYAPIGQAQVEPPKAVPVSTSSPTAEPSSQPPNIKR